MSNNFVPQMEPSFGEEEASAVYEYLKSGGWVMEFKKTDELEGIISEFTGSKYCMMTCNGTVSLFIALMALEVGRGDEVLVPDMTMIASPNSAVLAGATPILVDIDPDTLCMNINDAESKISDRTKALMYVPFNGRSGNMNEIADMCRRRNINLIEDSAQALGSYYKGKHLGTFGDFGSFSFSVPKIISTGQGGALITDSDELINKARKIKDFGRLNGGNDIHDEWGWNFKFTDIQAVIGIEQFKKLKERTEIKKRNYEYIYNKLMSIDEIEFIPTDLSDTVPWFNDIFVENRTGLYEHLKEKNIGTRFIYPPIHTQKIYKNESENKYSVAEHYSKKGLWLPSSSILSDDNLEYITSSIKSFFQDERRIT